MLNLFNLNNKNFKRLILIPNFFNSNNKLCNEHIQTGPHLQSATPITLSQFQELDPFGVHL